MRATDQGALVHDILCSIPGIGEPTAAAILIERPEIGTLGRKQIASLAGLAPMTRQSGQWRGLAFIQGGRKVLRDALYMPTLVAVRFNRPSLAQNQRRDAPASLGLKIFPGVRGQSPRSKGGQKAQVAIPKTENPNYQLTTDRQPISARTEGFVQILRIDAIDTDLSRFEGELVIRASA